MKELNNKRTHLYWYFLPLFCALFIPQLLPDTIRAQDITVSARLSGDSFPVTEAVLLTVTINGTSSATPPVPKGKGLEFTYRGQSIQSQWVNGKSSSTIIFTYMVQAAKPGRYTIEPVRVGINNQEYASQPLSCTVQPVSKSGVSGNTSGSGTPGAQSGTSARLRSGKADTIGFMRIHPEHTKIYPGQLIHMTIKAFFRQGLRVTLNSSPRLTGNDFILHSLDEKPRQIETRINGQEYVELSWDGTISAIKEGEFPLVFDMDASLLVRINSQQRRDPFGGLLGNDPFFDDFFARYSRREVKLITPDLPITVRPLPTKNRPADFSGAIGSFSLAVAATPRKAKVGDPITLKMKISGTGNFDLVESPQLTKTTGWKTYPSQGTVEQQHPGQGEKTFEQAIVPTSPTIASIPAVRFSYFDPDLADYITLSSDPLEITLEQATNEPQPRQSQPEKNVKEKEPLPARPQPQAVPLRHELGTMVHAITPLYKKQLFIVTISAAMLGLFLAIPLYSRRKTLENHPERAVRKKVDKELTSHIRAMEDAMAAHDHNTFITHCRRAIQKYFALQWDVTPGSITLADLQQHLPAQHPFTAIFSQLEQADFSHEPLPRQTMQSMLETTRKELLP